LPGRITTPRLLPAAGKLRIDARSRCSRRQSKEHPQLGIVAQAFRITGIDPRRPKYPFSAECLPDRQGFMFTAEQVAVLLRAGMKDLTPRG